MVLKGLMVSIGTLEASPIKVEWFNHSVRIPDGSYRPLETEATSPIPDEVADREQDIWAVSLKTRSTRRLTNYTQLLF